MRFAAHVIVIISIACAAAFSLLFTVAVFASVRSNDLYFAESIGAFMGAFSALILLPISKIFSRYFSRKDRHFNALIRLEQRLASILFFNDRNIALLENTIRHLEQKMFLLVDYKQDEIPQDILLDLHNVDIMQEVAKMRVDIDQTTLALETSKSFLAELKSKTSAGITEEQFIDEMEHSAKNCRELLGKLQEVTEDAKVLISKARVLIDIDRTIWSRIIRYAIGDRYPRHFEELWKEELERLEQEFQLKKSGSGR